jgi:hypothetical protein
MIIVFGFVARATEQQFPVYHRYFGAFGLMAKNDIFFQFEHNLVADFHECFEMALSAYGDWDGDPQSFDGVVSGLFLNMTEGAQFVGMVAEVRGLAAKVRAFRVDQPITLEHVGKAKIIFDTYIVLKAANYVRAEMAKQNLGMPPEESPV